MTDREQKLQPDRGGHNGRCVIARSPQCDDLLVRKYAVPLLRLDLRHAETGEHIVRQQVLGRGPTGGRADQCLDLAS
jgi:hypothetical protein